MAQLPEGTLMRRAAFGLARHARRMLGRTAGRRVGLLVGAGDNGGDALWAGVELRRRGAGVVAVLLDPARAHPAGLAAFRRAGGHVVGPDAAGLAALIGADLVLDGIVGLSGRGGLRDPAPSLVAAVEHDEHLLGRAAATVVPTPSPNPTVSHVARLNISSSTSFRCAPRCARRCRAAAVPRDVCPCRPPSP